MPPDADPEDNAARYATYLSVTKTMAALGYPGVHGYGETKFETYSCEVTVD